MDKNIVAFGKDNMLALSKKMIHLLKTDPILEKLQKD